MGSLLRSSPPLPSLLSFSSTRAIVALPISRLNLNPIDLPSKSRSGLWFGAPIIGMKKSFVTVNGFSEIKGTGPDVGEPVSESDDEEDVVFEKLPLDSKLQQKLEQKMRMKLPKKIRLRRKKLFRKRRMRKRGRLPPSKVNKEKNA